MYDYLCEFAAVARAGSMRGAAQELNLAEPSLGRHISALEAQLGKTLLQRNSDGIVLTRDGLYALESALDIESYEKGLVKHFADPNRRRMERNLLVGDIVGSGSIKKRLVSSCSQLNDVGYNLTVSHVPIESLSQAIEALDRCDIDIVVRYVPLNPVDVSDAYTATPFGDVGLVAMADARTPLATRTTIDMEGLRGCIFAASSTLRGQESTLWSAFEERCKEHGFSPYMRSARYGSYTSLMSGSMDDVIVCCADAYSPSGSISNGRVAVPVTDIKLPVMGVTRKGDDVAYAIASSQTTDAQLPDVQMSSSWNGASC